MYKTISINKNLFCSIDEFQTKNVMIAQQLKHVTLILLAVIALVSCNNKKDDVNPQPASVQVDFSFAHFVGSSEADFNNIQYTNAIGNVYSIATLKYFISDITLHRADGSSVLINEEHYVDALDETTHTFRPGEGVPAGEYSSISLVFGLNAEKNVSGRFPNPPENAMEWPIPMGGGYHYMKLEGKFDSAGVVKNYQCHTGPTMGNQNFITVELPNSGFDVNSKGVTVTIRMNINNWWVSPNTLDLNDMTMIMGNQAMQVKLRDNGKEDVFSVLSVE
jgi:hypothetical protein